MGFKVTKLTLRDFRSYKDKTLTFDPRLTIIHGPNAQGKTNIIEALRFLTTGESFRNPITQDIMRWSTDSCKITLEAEGDGRHRTVEMTVNNNKRSFLINSKRAPSGALAGAIPSVLFIPQDLSLITGSSQARREELDDFGAQVAPQYQQLCKEYKRILQQRNRLLKEESPDLSLLEVLTEQLISYGVVLIEQRLKLFVKLAPYIEENYKKIDSTVTLNAHYLLQIENKKVYSLQEVQDFLKGSYKESLTQAFKASLLTHKDLERIRQQTLDGPQRDDILFTLDTRDARRYGSQGQCRTITLALKLAEVDVITEVLGVLPLLLLDDVMSELDERRRSALTRFVGEHTQTVITTANLGYFDQELVEKASLIAIGGEGAHV